jgi:hypothetical protein
MDTDIKKNYWKNWGLAVVVLLIVKISLGQNLSENSLFLLFCIYMIPIWVYVMYLNFRGGRNLIGYLEKHHHEKWAEITSSPINGPGGFNSFRSLPFVLSKDDLEDENVHILKKQYVGIIKFALTVFVTSIPVFILVMVL